MKPKPTVAQVGERALIERLKQLLPKPGPDMVGIGDDAAVLPPTDRRRVLSTDAQIQGTHFKSGWLTPAELGRRALVVNLSDLAAMAAVPEAALVSLVLPPALPVADVEGIYRGLAKTAEEYQVVIVGGNIARGPELSLHLTVTGTADRPALRSVMQPGDHLLVTGRPGLASVGLRMLQQHAPGGDALAADTAWRKQSPLADAAPAVKAWIKPVPRLGAAEGLRLSRRVACIDLSDSLVRSLGHLVNDRLDVILDELPLDSGLAKLARSAGLEPESAVLHGGEDYELLMALGETGTKRILQRNLPGVERVRRVGRAVAGSGKIFLETATGREELTDQAYRHFG